MTAPNNRERISPALIDEEIKESFINYSMSVIVSRALPDVRDGLKPVHRRVLYAMNELGLVPGPAVQEVARPSSATCSASTTRTATASVYDALVRMVQDFSLRYPLVDGQGNFGSVDGDPAAAYRYTEARLTRDRDGDAGRHRQEHRRLRAQLRRPARRSRRSCPSAFPNLLVNGSSGIAVGMATNIPPHNLREVVSGDHRADRQSRDRPPASSGSSSRAPTSRPAATSTAARGSRTIRRRGAARIVMRARAVIEEKESSNKSQIVVTEIPYQVNKARARREHRRAGARQEARGHQRPARRVGPRRHAHRHRAQARCDSARRAEPAVQAHARCSRRSASSCWRSCPTRTRGSSCRR